MIVTPLYFSFYKDEQHSAVGCIMIFLVVLIIDCFKNRYIQKFIFNK